MKAAGILETVLYADDIGAAEAFYGGVFGLDVVRRLDGRFVFFRCGAGMLLVFEPGAALEPRPGNPVPPHGARGPGHVCFRAGDGAEIDRWQRHLAGRGVAIEAALDWPGGGRSIYVRDPAGNSVEIAESRIWDPPSG